MTAYFKKFMDDSRRGFTLIELLIVMAILGVLAVVVLVAINPIQQLARTRDTGRKSGVTQLGHALDAYYTARNGEYVAEGTTWITALSTSGELSTIPSLIQYGISGISGCSNAGANPHNSWCYDLDTTGGTNGPAVVYAELESNVERSKCGSGVRAWFVYSSADGRGGLMCDAVPTPGTQNWNTTQ